MVGLKGVALVLIGLAGAFAESMLEDGEKQSIPGIDSVIQHAQKTAAYSGVMSPGDDEPLEGDDRRLWSCTDQDWGATDSAGDRCSYYFDYPDVCGFYDDWDFRAYEMCCGCGGGCTDQDWGARDSGGDACDYYFQFPSDCGWFDDWDFRAYQMCCACGGGGYYNSVAASDHHAAASTVSVNVSASDFNDSASDLADAFSGRDSGDDEPLEGDDRRLGWMCTDQDWGARDSLGNICYHYSMNPIDCGWYDDWDFRAYEMCCGCGGGSRCTDQDWGARDSGWATCDHYYDFSSDCGWFDNWDFRANEMCCACGGGYYNYVAASDHHAAASTASVNGSASGLNDSASDLADAVSGRNSGDDEPLEGDDRRLWSCTDQDWGARDSGGDTCWYYSNNPSDCGWFDDRDFRAYEMCCACGGGEVGGGCTDQDWGARDYDGYTCGYYSDFPSDCGWYDDWDFRAYEMCCACGGGGYYNYVAASDHQDAASTASVNGSASDLNDSASDLNDSASDLNDSSSDLNDSASDLARSSGCIGLRGCRRV